MTREEAINNLKKVLGFSPTYDEAFYTLFPNGDQPSLPSDVDEAAHKYAKLPGETEHEWYDGGKLEGFKAGVKWRDAQILKLPNDADEAAENYIAPIENDEGLDYINFNGRDIKDAFIAGAEWQASQMPMPEDTVLFQNGVAEGRRLEREDMLKDAVEGKIYGYEDGSYELVASWLDLPKGGIYKDGDKVRIVVLKEEEE